MIHSLQLHLTSHLLCMRSLERYLHPWLMVRNFCVGPTRSAVAFAVHAGVVEAAKVRNNYKLCGPYTETNPKQ